MKRLIIVLMTFASSASAQTIYLPYKADNWSTSPGEWEVPYEVRFAPFDCVKAVECISFLAKVEMKVPNCLRYLNPKVIHNGREIPGHVDETGTPGEADWSWSFRTDELFTGPVIWKVTTIDVCQKVG